MGVRPHFAARGGPIYINTIIPFSHPQMSVRNHFEAAL